MISKKISRYFLIVIITLISSQAWGLEKESKVFVQTIFTGGTITYEETSSRTYSGVIPTYSHCPECTTHGDVTGYQFFPCKGAIDWTITEALYGDEYMKSYSVSKDGGGISSCYAINSTTLDDNDGNLQLRIQGVSNCMYPSKGSTQKCKHAYSISKSTKNYQFNVTYGYSAEIPIVSYIAKPLQWDVTHPLRISYPNELISLPTNLIKDVDIEFVVSVFIRGGTHSNVRTITHRSLQDRELTAKIEGQSTLVLEWRE